MSEDVQRAERSGLSMTVTVSRQPAFVPTVEALTVKIGEYVGCPADSARSLGQAVGRVLDEAWRHLGPEPDPGRFDLVFHGDGRLLRVDVSCRNSLPPGVSFEDALGGAASLSGLRALVDRVEFGHADGGPYCRLTRQIRETH